jgi:hypothetical protein
MIFGRYSDDTACQEQRIVVVRINNALIGWDVVAVRSCCSVDAEARAMTSVSMGMCSAAEKSELGQKHRNLETVTLHSYLPLPLHQDL